METTKRGAGQIALAASVMLAVSAPPPADALMTQHQRHGQGSQDQAPMLRIDRLPADGGWHDDDLPYLFDGQWLQAGQSLQTHRAIHVRQAAGIQVAWPHTLELAGAIENTPGAQQGLRKTGHGTLVLSAANHYRGNTELFQGALQLTHAAALGNPLRALAASTGTRLVFAPGIHVRHGLQFNALPTHPGLALEAGDGPWEPQAVQWSVDAGSAAYTGELIGSAALRKLGGGILLLGGNAAVYDGPLDLAEGGLGLHALFGGAVAVRQEALLGGNGGVRDLTVEDGGLFAPGIQGMDGIAGIGMGDPAGLAAAYGMPGFLGHDAWTFRVQGTLHLREQAVMRVQAFPDGRASLVRVGGVARLGGTLLVLPAAGDWPQQSRHVVLEAGQLPQDSRFAQVRVLPWQASDADMPVLEAALAYDDRHALLTLTRPQVAGPDPDPGREPDPGGEPEPQPPQKPEPPDEPGPAPEPQPAPQPPTLPPPHTPQEPVAPQIPETQPPASEEPGAVPEVTPIPPPAVIPPPSLTWRASTHSAAIRSQLLSDSRFLRQAVLSRHAQTDTLSFVGDSAIAWGQAYGVSGQRRGTQGTLSTEGIARAAETNGTESPKGGRSGQGDRRSLQGLVLGLDRILGHGWLAGAYLGLQQMHWRQQANAAQARLRTVQGGIHAEHWAGPWRMTAGVALGSTKVSGQSSGILPDGWTTGTAAWHAIPTPPSRDRYRISTRQAFLSLQYGMRHADWLLTPFMHLAWVWQTAPAHIQAGGGLRVVVAKARDRVRELEAGLRLQHRADFGNGLLQWHVQASLRHAHAPAFVAQWQGELDGWRAQGWGQGTGMATRAVRLQTGLDYRVGERIWFGLIVEGQRGAGQRDAAGLLWLRWAM